MEANTTSLRSRVMGWLQGRRCLIAASCIPTSRPARMSLLLICAWLSIMYVFFYNEDTLVFQKKAPHTWLMDKMFRKPPSECLFPRTDPFDPALESVVRTFPPLDCSNQTANVVYLENYVLHVNHSKLHLVVRPGQNFSHCCYKEIIRREGMEIDTEVNISWVSEKFTHYIPIPEWNEHILSECYDTNKTVLSRSYFTLIRKKPEIEKEQQRKYLEHVRLNSPLETLSFFVIGIDGMSRQNFERSMPKTRNYLIDKMGAIELYKYNKLAFDTFPNVLALLTGHIHTEFYRDWNYNRTGFVDQINEAFLWTEAKSLGYRTAMMLDSASITAFHYQKKGFKELPVHYYQRQTVVASYKDELMRAPEDNCLGDIPEVTVVHEPWLQLARTFGKDRTTPFFAYSFAVHITHDESDLASKGDDAYHKFLQDLVATNSLDNTVIVWFSDHGPRFGPVRETYHGRIETSTPYVFFVFPPWFKRKYPEMMKTLEINRHRLSSHFDLYATLRDLMYMKKGPREPATVKERAISLFREIPRERTCDQAGIPGEFCVCGRYYEPKLSQATYYLLALTLLEKINSFVGFVPNSPAIGASGLDIHPALGTPQFSKNSSDNTLEFPKMDNPRSLPSPDKLRKLCAHLTLHKVESVYQITNDQLQSLAVNTYRVTIRTEPGSGLFEGLVNFEEAIGSAQVMGEVVRINMYRGQADCVVDPWLRQFCFCLDKGDR